MPQTLTYPGVYIEEVPSGVRTITGVATSIAMFIGRAKRGPMKKPTRCLNYSEFARVFSDDSSYSDLPRSVRMFFDNGGSQCYVVRVAQGATKASVTLKSEGNAPVLVLTAKDAGVTGEKIRAAVTYNGPQPEVTFNIELFRWGYDRRGQPVKEAGERWSNLSMDPDSLRYAPDFITQNSQLVDAALEAALAEAGPPAGSGYSQSGRPVAFDDAGADPMGSFSNAWSALLGSTAATNKFRISVDGNAPVPVSLEGIDIANLDSTDPAARRTALGSAIGDAINAALPAGAAVTASFEDGPTPAAAEGTASSLLRITSDNGDVFIELEPDDAAGDVAAPLMLGTALGGLEVSRYSALRPAATGIAFMAPTGIVGFAGMDQNAFDTITVNGKEVALGTSLQTVAAQKMYRDGYAVSANGNNDGVREKTALLAKAVNDHATENPNDFKWRAEVWGQRLAIIPIDGGDNVLGSVATASTDIGASFSKNVRYYSVGIAGVAGLQAPATQIATDGVAPGLAEYKDAYDVIDSEVDLFNLLILPTDKDHTDAVSASRWGPASVFCQGRRAFLLMDPPSSWADANQPLTPSTPINVNSLRIGLVKDHAALFYPRLTINENGNRVQVGPSGAAAGLMSRIDASRGVWKAPAGRDADIRNVVGVEHRFSDAENGLLNPRAVNTLRLFTTGVVNWGARTMDGDDDFGSEWKYIPIRRLALFIEESLYRGTQWVVFEPNDEPLWAQIRLNVGAFMNNLFRQGAFQGTTPRDAYFVKCDAETTTQNDRNLGVVNILVGFAPLKPAEFVVIKLQQVAGQIQT